MRRSLGVLPRILPTLALIAYSVQGHAALASSSRDVTAASEGEARYREQAKAARQINAPTAMRLIAQAAGHRLLAVSGGATFPASERQIALNIALTPFAGVRAGGRAFSGNLASADEATLQGSPGFTGSNDPATESSTGVIRTRILASHPNRFRFLEGDNGTLYAAFVENPGQRQILKLSTSTNGGIDWSRPRDVYQAADGEFIVDVADIDGSGSDLWLTFLVEVVKGGDVVDNRVIVAVSHDSGGTFSAVDVGAPSDAQNGGNLQTELLDDTTLVFWSTGTGLAGDPRTILVSRSTDGGRTYALHQLSEAPGDAAGPFVAVADGAIIAVWANAGSNTIRSVTSQDGGATWTGEVVVQNGCCIRATAVWQGTVYLISAIAIARTTDFGLSWTSIPYGEHGHETGLDVAVNDQGLHTLRLEAAPEAEGAFLWRVGDDFLPHGADHVTEQLLGEDETLDQWQFPVLWGGADGLMAVWAEQDVEGRTEAIASAISRDQGSSFNSWRVHGPDGTGFVDVALWPGLATIVYGKTTGSGNRSNTSLFLATTPDDGGTTETVELATGLNATYGQSAAFNLHGYLATDRSILIGSGTEDEAVIIAVDIRSIVAPSPPAGPWLETATLPGFCAKVRISAGSTTFAGEQVTPCIGETLCVSGAVVGRAEVFVRLVGPKPNGKLWPTLVKFSTSRVEVWLEQTASGFVRYYDLAAVAAGEQALTLDGLADKLGFDPTTAASALLLERDMLVPDAPGGSAAPSGPWLETAALPGFRAKVRVTGGSTTLAGEQVTPCIGETLCVSGAVAGRAEVFVRVVGPKPNGKLWPTLVKFSTSRVEVWLEQTATGVVRYYDLAAVVAGEQTLTLDGLAEKLGFDP